jgi:Domain of unknown function (DUF397)
MPEGRSGWPSPDSGFTSWTKSSLSFANGNCVEVANLPGGHVGVRDSKDTAGLALRFTPDEWRAFLGGVRKGEFDRFGELLVGAGRLVVQLSLVVRETSGEGPSSCREGPSPCLGSRPP